MRQKYLISRDLKKKELKLMEYAVIDKDLENVASEDLHTRNYFLMGEEVYDSEKIIQSISHGNTVLVETIRTNNIFPIGPFMLKIIEIIIELYDIDEDGTKELFFDDMELISVK